MIQYNNRKIHPKVQQSADDLGLQVLPNNVIEPGDMYLARGNTAIHFLTCKINDQINGILFPTCNAYPFNTVQCFKVTEL